MPKVDLYMEEAHEKRRKRRIYFFSIAGILAANFLLVALVWFFTGAPFFKIRNIAVSGNSTVSDAAVLDLLRAEVPGKSWVGNLLGFHNLLAWPKELSAANLSLVPALKSIAIAKDYSAKTVNVAVVERVPYAIWCGMAGASSTAPPDCFWFDKSGVMFKRTLNAEGNIIFAVHDYAGTALGIGSRILPDGEIPNLVSVLDALRASRLSVKEIRLNDLSLEELEVDTWNGPKAYFSLRFGAENTLPVIQSFLGKPGFKNLEYLDFRVENRVYYK